MRGVKVCNNNLQPLFSFSPSIIKNFWLKWLLQQVSEARKKNPKASKWGRSPLGQCLLPGKTGAEDIKPLFCYLLSTSVWDRSWIPLSATQQHFQRFHHSTLPLRTKPKAPAEMQDMTQHTLRQPHFAAHRLIMNLLDLRNPGA